MGGGGSDGVGGTTGGTSTTTTTTTTTTSAGVPIDPGNNSSQGTNSTQGMNGQGHANTDTTMSGSYFARTLTEPPPFPKDKTSLKRYKIDLERWDRRTKIPAVERGDILMMSIPEDHKYKDVIELNIGEQMIDNLNATTLLINQLEKLYGVTNVLEGFMRLKDLLNKKRGVGEELMDYVTSWEVIESRAREKDVNFNDKVRAYLLLLSCNLSEVDLQIILKDVNHGAAGQVYDQAKQSLRENLV